MKMMWEKHGRRISLMILFLLILVVMAGMENFGETSSEDSVKLVEEAVRRAVVQCYAIEGSYPPDLAYLTRHYGLVLNEEAYFYHYEVLGANLMPQIGVYERWQ